MGISLEIFSLYRLAQEDANCSHYLLLKVDQAAFSNADAGEYNYVVEVADRIREALIEVYRAEQLANECTEFHVATLIGELQNTPIGEELRQEHSKFYLDLWVAETRFGHPWVVLGTAEDEEAFWQQVEEDGDFARLEALRPAAKLRAFFLTEMDIWRSRYGHQVKDWRS
ncbi:MULTISPECIES: hypothetical protein [Trichocoleus]|uniref:Uncharacterized protein n=1 Tax=Trichocoleus desertorum GB2-A4 TaxID=2933944 RepID=A0ABV0JBL2_9CYAN|nr:hypothetical protein [Trichocoleus sp. FACHB-46]MBD1860958.1 hypothetical protein [Trichocoleus sp. FACHB-46]